MRYRYSVDSRKAAVCFPEDDVDVAIMIRSGVAGWEGDIGDLECTEEDRMD